MSPPDVRSMSMNHRKLNFQSSAADTSPQNSQNSFTYPLRIIGTLGTTAMLNASAS